ncbi:capsid maturation protease [Cyprinid herpesvirus 3]|nr:capsid maturation protease [Cyprinid herpesvirus 3]
MAPHLRSRSLTARHLTESRTEGLSFHGQRPDGTILAVDRGRLLCTHADIDELERTLLGSSAPVSHKDLVPIYCDRCLPYTLPWSQAPVSHDRDGLLPAHGYTVVGTAGVFSRDLVETKGMEKTSQHYHLPLRDLELFTHTQKSNRVLLVHCDIPIGSVICYWHVHDRENAHCAVNALIVITDQAFHTIFSRCKGLSWTTTSVVASELSLVGIPGRASSLIHSISRLSDLTQGTLPVSRKPDLRSLGYGRNSPRHADVVMAALSKGTENPEETASDQRREWKQMVEMLMGQLDLLYEATIAKGPDDDGQASKRYLSEGRDLFKKLHELKAHLEKLESASTPAAVSAAAPAPSTSVPAPQQTTETPKEDSRAGTPEASVTSQQAQSAPVPSQPVTSVPSQPVTSVPSQPVTSVPSQPVTSVQQPNKMASSDDIRDAVAKALADVIKPSIQQYTPPPQPNHGGGATGFRDFVEMFKLMQQMHAPAQAPAPVAAPAPVVAQVPQSLSHHGLVDDEHPSTSAHQRGGKRKLELSDDDIKLFKKLREQDELSRREKERLALKEELKKEMMAEFSSSVPQAAAPVVVPSTSAPAPVTDVKQLVSEAIKELLAVQQQQQQQAVVPAPQGVPGPATTISLPVATLAAATGRSPAAAAALQSAINNVHESASQLVPGGLNLGVAGVPVNASTVVSTPQPAVPSTSTQVVSVSAGLEVQGGGNKKSLNDDARKMMMLMMDH